MENVPPPPPQQSSVTPPPPPPQGQPQYQPQVKSSSPLKTVLIIIGIFIIIGLIVAGIAGFVVWKVFNSVKDEVSKNYPSVVQELQKAVESNNQDNGSPVVTGEMSAKEITQNEDDADALNRLTAGTIVWQDNHPSDLICWDVSAGTEKTCSIGKGFSATPDGKPLGAVEYCQHLQADGVTISNNIVGYWRLPTSTVLNNAADKSRSSFHSSGYWTRSDTVNETTYHKSGTSIVWCVHSLK